MFTEIEYFDVVVVGGGIAGVAIAEYLGRHTNLSIKLLEKETQLGTLASGKLEGWFHTGGLYSGQDDAQTLLNCVNSLEDLINLYTPHFPQQCNVTIKETQPNFFNPVITPQPQGWFSNDPVYLIHPRGESCPEINISNLRSDTVLMEIQLNRVLGRLEVAYGQQHNWLNQGKAIAPTYTQIEDYEGLNCSLLSQNQTIENLCRRFDASYNLEYSDYAIIKTLDCSMNTHGILRDLVSSALTQGVKFETGITIKNLGIDRYGPIKIKSLSYNTQEGLSRHLKAKIFIFAVGEGFQSFLSDLQLRAKLKRSRSAMIVAFPALIDHNFVRMSTKNRFHFNHFIQRHEQNQQEIIYSMLANSGYTNDENFEVDIDPLLESAERYFGKDKLYSRQLYSYECIKTEFISQEEQKRRYSYWIESDPQSNYICVLPGKFSFFPTVAFQTYKKVKTMINIDQHSPQSPANFPPNIQHQANKLVRNNHALEIIL